MAPMDVAVASANSALSILDLKPGAVSMARSSSSLKMPVRRPVPIKVPMVSNVSDKLKEKNSDQHQRDLRGVREQGTPVPRW